MANEDSSSRKRLLDDKEQDEETASDKRLRLSTENLGLLDQQTRDPFEHMGGPESESGSTTPSLKPRGYGLHPEEEEVIRNGILPPWRSPQPTPENIGWIRQGLDRARGSPEPSEAEFRLYSRRIKYAPNSASVMALFMPLFFKQYDAEPWYAHAVGMEMDNFDFSNYLEPGNVLDPPQPDVVQGLLASGYTPYRPAVADGGVPFLDREVGSSVESIALPHFTGRFAGYGSIVMSKAVMCAYDAAALLYARKKSLEYIDASEPGDYAPVMSFVSHGETVRLFAHYALPEKNRPGRYEFHMFPVTCTKFRIEEGAENDPVRTAHAYDQFLTARRLLRNAQELSRSHTYHLRRLLARRTQERLWREALQKQQLEAAQKLQREEAERLQREEAERQEREAAQARADAELERHLESAYSFVDEYNSDEYTEDWDEEEDEEEEEEEEGHDGGDDDDDDGDGDDGKANEC